jgi:lipoprotein NlpI
VWQYELPFKLWFLFKEKRKKEKETRDRLVRTFRRHKTRQWLYKIMRFWRHQVRTRDRITKSWLPARGSSLRILKILIQSMQTAF